MVWINHFNVVLHRIFVSMHKRFALFLFVALIVSQLAAQIDRPTPPAPTQKEYVPKKMFQFYTQGAAYLAGGDLSSRFAGFTGLGLGLGYKTFRNITVGARVNTLFGKNVLETNMLDNLKGTSGEILDANGQFASINYVMRGTLLKAQVGKIVPLGKNLNSGLWFQGGFCYMTTRIKIEYQKNVLPQLDNDMYKGYDRLTGGLGFSGSFGYHHITANNTVSYYACYNLARAGTQNLRGYQYDLNNNDQTVRNDLMSSISVGIILPIKEKTKSKESFY